MIEAFMQSNEFKLSGIFGLVLFLASCGVADNKVDQSREKLRTSEAPQTLIKSTITIGQRNFEATFAGDFNDPVCLSIKNTLDALPKHIDIIAQLGEEKTRKVFRQDILIDALRDTDLPFIQWENVPVGERKRAIFSASRAHPGYLKKLDTRTTSGDIQYKYHIFDEPHAKESNEYITYNQWRSTWPDVEGQKDWPIKKYRLNEFYTLYDIKPQHPIKKFSKKQILDWKETPSPYFASDYHIIGPAMTLRYSFKSGEAEFPIKRNFGYPNRLDDMNYDISELIWNGEFLTAISFDDDLFSGVRQKNSIKVTRFNSADFLTKSVVDKFSKITSSKQIEAQRKDSLNPKSVGICDVTLLLQ